MPKPDCVRIEASKLLCHFAFVQEPMHHIKDRSLQDAFIDFLDDVCLIQFFSLYIILMLPKYSTPVTNDVAMCGPFLCYSSRHSLWLLDKKMTLIFYQFMKIKIHMSIILENVVLLNRVRYWDSIWKFLLHFTIECQANLGDLSIYQTFVTLF